MARTLTSSIEPLEARIAPAGLAAYHPLLDIVAGIGKTGAMVDLGSLVDSAATAGERSHVEFTTNFDIDPVKTGLQPGKIVLELFDEKAPLTVQNFLRYVNNANDRGDYDGVYFHRLVSGFVLQGGGFEAAKPGVHIPVGQNVHNEFAPTDPERSNLAGTVAMAKVAGDPNTATSEFFFNLADNSGNLDHQNGGFTVFGKVVQGMDVVNAIAALSTTTVNGSPAPYTNGYNPDPDANPDTAAPAIKANQLTQIISAKVLPAHNSAVAHTSYSVMSITDAAGASTDLVTGQLVGDTLSLKYKPGASGVATVKVRVTDTITGEEVFDQFDVTVKPNLLAQSGGDTLVRDLVAGDSGTGTVKLVNTGGATASGTVDVKFYLSHADGYDSTGLPLGADPNGTILDASDVQVGALMGAQVNIASGKTGSLTANLSLPGDIDLASGNYRLISQVTTAGGSTITELFIDDNLAYDGNVHAFHTGAAAGNLAVYGVVDKLPIVIVPGDVSTAQIVVGNTASHTAAGDVSVSFYLSHDLLGATADTLDANDLLIGSVTQQNVSLDAGETLTLQASIQVPQLLGLTDGYYRIFGLVTSPSGSSNIVELTGADNLGATNYHLLTHGFGSFSYTAAQTGFGFAVGRTNAVLTYQDAQGNPISLQMKGPGFGFMQPGTAGGIEVLTENTSLASTFSVTAPAGVHAVFENVYTSPRSLAPIGSIALGNVDFSGEVIAFGGAKSLSLGDTNGAGNHFVGIAATNKTIAVRPVIKLGEVQDLALTSQLPVASLTALDWTDVSAATEMVEAASLISFKVNGNFEADMYIHAGTPAATLAMKTFDVGGSLRNSTVRIQANVGAITLGAIHTSKFLVGTESVPGALQDFNLARAIGSIVINGAAGETYGLVDSDIAAARIGSVKIMAQVDTTSGADGFGFSADKIASYTRGISTTRNLDTGTMDAQNNYRVAMLS